MDVDKTIVLTDADYFAVWPMGKSSRREYPLEAGKSLLALATAARDGLHDPSAEHELGLNDRFHQEQYAVLRRRELLGSIITPLEAMYGPVCADDVETYLREISGD